MAAHARLKNKFTDEEKYHNLMTWLTNVSDVLLTFNLDITLTVLKLYIALKILILSQLMKLWYLS